MRLESDELRTVVLRLLLRNGVRATKLTTPMLIELEELGMVTPAKSAGQYVLRADKTDALRRYVAVRWPGLAAAESAFSTRPGKISAAALRELRRTPLRLPPDIRRLNRKTWSAWAGAHSKSGHCGSPQGLVLTSDESLRLRPNAGLWIFGGRSGPLLLDTVQSLFGEVAIPERGFEPQWRLGGIMPDLIITVENRGAFIDFPSVPRVLLLHAPGHNTVLATRFIGRLPNDIPWLHFPDFDPGGIAIAMLICCRKQLRRPVTWIPVVALTLLETHALPLDLPWPPLNLPPKLRDDPVLTWLIQNQCWLEQEALVLMPQFAEELAQLVKSSILGNHK